MKYTQGEWRLAYDAQGPCMIMHPTKEGVAIASLTNVHKPSNGFHDTENWPEERNANAYLIYAAPALLEEHKQWAKILGRIIVEALQDNFEYLKTIALPSEVEFVKGIPSFRSEAIAKAKGE